ncbi:uncharacterized protein EHS24_003282 [Apiotrichum porosum]|uniref:Transmembrane protein n=1 Tax=Apiotrichum porosum TaxID=105984 RepID=A0A427XFQ1_9TREE|nr:uncharacterized protein EHS24_003282 [Apiotrichum porosum]RSH77715.1 hypothetical protein EHS24_003282 [Apiotrichum porosum]
MFTSTTYTIHTCSTRVTLTATPLGDGHPVERQAGQRLPSALLLVEFTTHASLVGRRCSARVHRCDSGYKAQHNNNKSHVENHCSNRQNIGDDREYTDSDGGRTSDQQCTVHRQVEQTYLLNEENNNDTDVDVNNTKLDQHNIPAGIGNRRWYQNINNSTTNIIYIYIYMCITTRRNRQAVALGLVFGSIALALLFVALYALFGDRYRVRKAPQPRPPGARNRAWQEFKADMTPASRRPPPVPPKDYPPIHTITTTTTTTTPASTFGTTAGMTAGIAALGAGAGHLAHRARSSIAGIASILGRKDASHSSDSDFSDVDAANANAAAQADADVSGDTSSDLWGVGFPQYEHDHEHESGMRPMSGESAVAGAGAEGSRSPTQGATLSDSRRSSLESVPLEPVGPLDPLSLPEIKPLWLPWPQSMSMRRPSDTPPRIGDSGKGSDQDIGTAADAGGNGDSGPSSGTK